MLMQICYKVEVIFSHLSLEAFHPESERIALVDVDFSELVNMKGKFNVTIPHPALTYTGANFNLETDE